MDLWTGPIAAGTLAVLWTCEAIIPALPRPGAGFAQRARHLTLGLMNAAIGSVTALLLLGADALARSHDFGLFRAVEWPWWAEFVIILAIFDLWHYICHVLAHEVPLLWRFHAIHHNADKMEATVAMRFHAVEIAVLCLLMIPVAVLLGAGVHHVLAYNLVMLPVSMFHHSDLRLSPRVDRVLRWFIVTPRMHWLHHSRWQPETNSNYAAVLSIWDRLFGTMRSRRRAETVSLGLDGHRPEDIDTLGGMMSAPFGPVRSEYGERPPDEDLQPDDEPLIRRTRDDAAPDIRPLRT